MTLKQTVKVISINLGLFLAILIVLEMVLRFFPVSESAHRLEVNEQNPVIRFKENRDIIWSNGWNFEIVTNKHSNNYGFFDDQDYVTDSSLPLMALIGDSYIQALQVENSSTVHGRLSKKVGEDGRVYSFASTGAALTTYLAYAAYVRDQFHADAMTFVIVGNDFDESLCKYKYKPSFHCFVETNAGRFQLIRRDYRIPSGVDVFRESALFRYIIFNLKIVRAQRLRSALHELFGKEKRAKYIGNVPEKVSLERFEHSKAAVDEFFKQLPRLSGLSSNQVLFVVDGVRRIIYDGHSLNDAKRSYWGSMRTYFIRTAEELGYEVIDMHERFTEDYKNNKERFEFRIDNHWNERAHYVVAKQIEKSKVFERTFPR